MGRPPLDLTRMDLPGSLTAVRPTGGRQGTAWLWLFRCACGREHVANGPRVARGVIRSCGCGKGRHARARPKARRDFEIVLMDEGGHTLAEIARKYRISRQRVRMVLLRERGRTPCTSTS